MNAKKITTAVLLVFVAFSLVDLDLQRDGHFFKLSIPLWA
jgi:hypothetical protein